MRITTIKIFLRGSVSFEIKFRIEDKFRLPSSLAKQTIEHIAKVYFSLVSKQQCCHSNDNALNLVKHFIAKL